MQGAREYPSGSIVTDREDRVKMLGLQLVNGCRMYPQKYPKELWCVTIGLPGYTADRIESDIIHGRKKFKYLSVVSALPSATAFAFKWLLLVTSRDGKRSKGSNGLAKVAVMLGEALVGSPAPGTHVEEFGWNPDWSERKGSMRNPVLAFPILEVVTLCNEIKVGLSADVALLLSISLLVTGQSRGTKKIVFR